MDALYFLQHSKHDDVEIRYSLRSIERHFPDVHKVWILGDRPRFLSDDSTQIEVLPHDTLARFLGCNVPVTNFFLMFAMSCIIPDLQSDFLWFCDDFVLLEPLSIEKAKTAKYLEDLQHVEQRGRGLWLDGLWRTYDLLRRFGYPGFNFETHTPTWFKKQWIIDAYSDLKDYVTEDRWFGLTGPTAILNHAIKHSNLTVEQLSSSDRAGYYGAQPSFAQVQKDAIGKKYLSFDDAAFGKGIRQFLISTFPTRSKYEA